MPARLLHAAPVRAEIHEILGERIKRLREARITPRLDVVLVGDDPASQVYVGKKIEAGKALGITGEIHRFPATTDPSQVERLIERLNSDPLVHGILIQRPLPKQFNGADIDLWIAPEKDVDCFHPVNVGLLHSGSPIFVPCTPAGILALLGHYHFPFAGKIACVIGRSPIVGKPMAALLLQQDMTVIHCHSRTKSLASLTKLADLIVVAAGKPGLLKGSMVKKGAVVVDVGIHRKKDGSLVGDADFKSVAKVAKAVTPVPGGVGPMTIGMLLANTVKAAEVSVSQG